MIKNLKFKIELNESQKKSLKKIEDVSRTVWNLSVAQYNSYFDDYEWKKLNEKPIDKWESYDFKKLVIISKKYNKKISKQQSSELNKFLKNQVEKCIDDSLEKKEINIAYSFIKFAYRNEDVFNLELCLKVQNKELDKIKKDSNKKKETIDYGPQLSSCFESSKKYNKPSWKSQDTEMTQLKKNEKLLELRKVYSSTITQILKTVDSSVNLYFSNLKNNPKAAGRPKFKSNLDKSIIVFRDSQVKLLEGNPYSSYGYIDVRSSGKEDSNNEYSLGIIKFKKYRNIPSEIKKTVFKKEGNEWFVIFSVDVPVSQYQKTDSKIGIDLGIVKQVTMAKYEDNKTKPQYSEWSFPDYISKMEEKVIKLQKRLLSRKISGNRSENILPSNNYIKAKGKISKIKLKIKRAKDYHIKLFSSKIVKENSSIHVENLSIKNMTKSAKGNSIVPGNNVSQKTGLNRSILSKNWGSIISNLEQKCKEHDRYFSKVDPKNTSKSCSNCDHLDDENRESQSVFVCKKCGVSLNADANAALNVLRIGIGLKKIKKQKKNKIDNGLKSG